MKILVTGAGGFIGSNLVTRLSFATKDAEIVCMTRNAEKLKKKISNNNNSNVKIVEANVMDYVQIKDALSEIDIAYYLIHSMEGVSAKEWKKFAEDDFSWVKNKDLPGEFSISDDSILISNGSDEFFRDLQSELRGAQARLPGRLR